ncbi:MAG: carboxypeptidase-like regulatory domain-containing protein [Gemmatimonadetes bacterium]|nr:carboxypeptidase-like regulatory domain-containing protein [Gemmatimonadota bacterium]MYI07340.1 carboxypeptidase-like regulatory domain-containing protein [Gemmatimonadota bacterium]
MTGTAPWSDRAGGRFRVLAMALLAVAAGLPARGAAQIKVEGEVLDAATQLPVPGVILHLPDLKKGTITDEFGYFVLDSLPAGEVVVATHHPGYTALQEKVPVVAGETWVLRLTPSPVVLPGVEVRGRRSEELEARRTGRRSDFIGEAAVAAAGERTNKLLEVIRSKAPPRLQIRQQGGMGGVTFCIQSSRRRPSVQEMRELGTGCHPVLLVLDGVVIYSPPEVAEAASLLSPSLPSDVAALLLNQNPDEIASIKVLTPADGFFRYGSPGRLGAVEIKTKHPGRSKGPITGRGALRS